ncbi:MAG: GDSL-type esterase/lipase family protein [Microbacterium enclense]
MRLRALISAAAAAGILLASGVLAAPASAAQQPSGTRPYKVTQLGDSYSAGNGAGGYYGEPGAYRSHNNYATIYTNWLASQPNLPVQYESVAHSGAETVDVLADQIRQVDPDTDLAIFTIGGNDVNFQNIVRYCFVLGSRSASDCRQNVDVANARVPQVGTATQRIFQNLSFRLKPGADIVLVGYPHLTTADSFEICDYVQICFMRKTYDVSKGVRALADKARQMQIDAVNAWNATNPANRAIFVDGVDKLFAGHEPYPGQGFNNPKRWINRFFETETVQNGDSNVDYSYSADKMEWYHPGITGHAKLGEYLETKLGVLPRAQQIQADNRAVSASARDASLSISADDELVAADEPDGTENAAPEAWLQGPWVEKVGSTIDFDARGSVSGSGDGLRFDWDFDDDGTFDALDAGAQVSHTFLDLFAGNTAVRVTQDDGQSAVARVSVMITEDGDATTDGDNCPGVYNYSQSDEDGDGVGDACDDTPGHPTEDQPGVHTVVDGELERAGDDPLGESVVPQNTDGTAVSLSAVAATAGDTVTVTGTGFVPGDEAGLYRVPNETEPLATGTVAEDGTVTFAWVVPTSIPAGRLTIGVVAPAMFAFTELTVEAAPSEPAPGQPTPTPSPSVSPTTQPQGNGSTPDQKKLAQTGSPELLPAVLAGGVMLLGGVLLVASRRRRHAQK